MDVCKLYMFLFVLTIENARGGALIVISILVFNFKPPL
jgi:hypothetical protein